MNKIVLVPIEKIITNHYQEEKFVDQPKVLEIAESLLHYRDNGTKGLLQVPIARQVNGSYEQAFGRHRLYAFRWLVEQGHAFFSEMPLIVKDLGDQEMFELMAIENLQRRDISFIEEAETYHAYMTTFNKNSVETAARFSKTEEHIRGRLIFVQLPESAKEKAKAGEINVTMARSLVTTNKLIGAEGVDEVLKRLDDDKSDGIYDSPQEAIVDVLRDAPDLKEMPYKLVWLDVKKFPVKHLAPLAKKVVAEILDVAAGDVERKNQLAEVMQHLESGMEITDTQFPSFLPAQLDKLRTLVNPPACTACPFHAVLDGDDFCGLKLCYERKEQAWARAEVEKVWKEIGIPLYVNEATDGKAVELSRWEKADQKLFQERHADLRLKPTTSSVWNNFDGLPTNVKLIAVGKTAENRLKANGKAVEKAQTEMMSRELQYKIRGITDEHVKQFLWNVAVPAFASLLDSLSNLPFSLFIYDSVMYDAVEVTPGMDSKDAQVEQIEKAKRKADALKQLRRLMIAEILYRAMEWTAYKQFNGAKKPLVEFAKRCQKRADEWNWKLPKDFANQGQTAQAELEKAIKGLAQVKK